MPSTSNKSSNKYLLIYKDSYDCQMLSRELNFCTHDHQGYVIKKPKKFLNKLIMNYKRSPFAIQDKNKRDLDNAKDYPTIADLMRKQNVTNDSSNTVHYRRDLDSLG